MRSENKTEEKIVNNELLKLSQLIIDLRPPETRYDEGQKKLLENQDKYQLLFEELPIGIGLASLDGKVVYGNKAMETITGYSIEELKHIYLTDTYADPRDREELLEMLKQYGRVVNYPVQLKRKDGRVYDAILSMVPIHLNGESVIQTTCIDMTEHKQALEETNRLLETIETAREAICITSADGNGTIIYTNPALDELFGYNKGELIGKRARVFYAGSNPEAIGQWIKDDIESKGYWEGEVLKKKKNGTEFTSYAKVSAFRDKDGKILNFISTQHDITDRRQVEKELKEYRNHLEEIVEKRTAELAKASQQLKAEITERRKAEKRIKELYQREKGLRKELEKEINTRVELTRGLIHELKTPMTPMLGSSELLVDRIQDEGLLRIAKNINRGIRNLNNRINDLMDLTRAGIGRLQLRCLNVDIQQMLHEIVDYLAPDAEKKEQQLTLEISDSLPMVNADEDRLRQIILNIVNNAMKFTPTKGKINLRAGVMDHHLIVEVKDNGCGMTTKDQKQLFQPHYTLQTKGEGLSGLGIGLPLCKMLVELHGGSIWVKSRKGQGSTFFFSIPLR